MTQQEQPDTIKYIGQEWRRGDNAVWTVYSGLYLRVRVDVTPECILTTTYIGAPVDWIPWSGTIQVHYAKHYDLPTANEQELRKKYCLETMFKVNELPHIITPMSRSNSGDESAMTIEKMAAAIEAGRVERGTPTDRIKESRETAERVYKALSEGSRKAEEERDEAIAIAKVECRAKIREANRAFEYARKTSHNAYMDLQVYQLAEIAPIAIDELIGGANMGGERPTCVKLDYAKPDGTLSRWGRKMQAHARKMKEEGRL